jgi:predicted small lipoprotein YifL
MKLHRLIPVLVLALVVLALLSACGGKGGGY